MSAGPIILIVFIEILLNLNALNAEDPRVCLPELGCVQGVYMPGYQIEKFEAFLGIPFAEPPVGVLRFKNPEPVKPWRDVLSATIPKEDCIQKNYVLDDQPERGVEDCLYLNIYRPIKNNTANELLPVMFYIHGGGYFTGTVNPAVMDPTYFMDTQEVIIVTTNYRLGPFGFLSTGSIEMPGNLGLKDQQLALKWLQTNIGAFNGDAQSITLFGHSVGASSIQFHMLSENSKGLFQNCIMASGNALGPYVDVIEAPKQQVLKIAKTLNIENADNLNNQELLETLQTIDANSLLNAGSSLKSWHQFPLFNYRPTIEKADWPNAFLTAAPKELLKAGKLTQLPCLQSIVKEEGAVWTLAIWTHLELQAEFNKDFDEHLWQIMDMSKFFKAHRKQIILDLLVEEYFHGQRIVNNSTLNGFTELFSDFGFYYPFWKTTQHHVSYAMPNSPLYLMKFNFHGDNTYAFIYTGGSRIDYGVVHLDDLAYLFRSPALFPKDYAKNTTDAGMVREMVGIYVEFAKNSNIRGLDACTESTFNTSNDDAGICDYLEIFDHLEKGYEKVIHNEFNVKRMRLWDKILADEF